MPDQKNNTILLVHPDNSPFPYHVTTPLAIFCLGAYLENSGFNIIYYDERVQPVRQLYKALAEKPFLVGLTAMTSHQISRALSIAAQVRKHLPGVPLVWGGVHPSMCPEQTMESEWVDFAVIGEGEATLAELAKKILASGRDFSEIQGLAWKKDGQARINKTRAFLDIETLPFPYTAKARQMLPLYLKHETTLPVAGYQLSRGCRFKCGFCYSTFFHKGQCRIKSREKIKEELTSIRDLGVKKVIFYDDSLGGDKQLLYDLTDVMQELKMGWTASPRIEFFDAQLLKRFEDSGCQHLCLGIESPCERTLVHIEKGISSKRILEGVEVMAKARSEVTYLLMMGFPGESAQDLKELLDFVDEIRRRHENAEVFLQPYAPYPGTPLYAEALKNGFKPPQRLQDWSSFTMDDVHTPWIKNKALARNLYLITFMAFRYDWLLKGLKLRRIYYLLHRIALFRWKHRFFNLYIEGWFYRLYKKNWILYQKLAKG